MTNTLSKMFAFGFVALLLLGGLFLLSQLQDAGPISVGGPARQSEQLLEMQGVQITTFELQTLQHLNLGIVHVSEPLWDAEWEPDEFDHADREHPTEARMVRDCLKKNGVWRVFRNLTANDRFARVCKWPSPDEITGIQFAFQIVQQLSDGTWIEVNCYIPKLIDKSWGGFLHWMRGGMWQRAIK